MASQSERRNAGTRGPGSTRDRVLDAYETLLIEQGPGGATLDAVAAVAEVSKGGLLYHFSSKEALVSGLLARLRERSARDAELMRSDAAGTVAYYLRTSVPGHESPVGLTRTYLATLRVADGSSSGRPPDRAGRRRRRRARRTVRGDRRPGPGLAGAARRGRPLPAHPDRRAAHRRVSTEELLNTLRTLLAARSRPG